jgi:hypothetical protein
VQGLGFRVQGLGCRVYGLEFMDLRYRLSGLEVMGRDLGFRV